MFFIIIAFILFYRHVSGRPIASSNLQQITTLYLIWGGSDTAFVLIGSPSYLHDEVVEVGLVVCQALVDIAHLGQGVPKTRLL